MIAAASVSAVVPAAGRASRMGRFKPLLPFGSRNVIEHIISTFRQAGLQDIVVVTGHQAARLTPVLRRCGVRWVDNPGYREGMFSSIAAGISVLSPDSRAFFLLPADVPLVRPQTLRTLLSAFAGRERIVYPVFDGRRGHPPLISSRHIGAIRNWHGGEGLREFLKKHAGNSVYVEVDDPGVLLDMDTRRDYEALLDRLAVSTDS